MLTAIRMGDELDSRLVYGDTWLKRCSGDGRQREGTAALLEQVNPRSQPAGGGRRLARQLGRRDVLVAGLAVVVAACSGDDGSPTGAAPTTRRAEAGSTVSTPAPAATDRLTAVDFADVATCQLVPEKMAGPFPLDEQFDRRDITEGYPGHPLRLGLRVVDSACEPVPDAGVEVWQADASGDYSAFTDGGGGKDEAGGTTFLRGTQTAARDGIVEFMTIYPGWYPGRAVHIHLRVHLVEATVLTSQLFFDQPYTEQVYSQAPYREFGRPDTTNTTDQIAGDVATDGTLLALSPHDTVNGPGTLALLQLAVGP